MQTKFHSPSLLKSRISVVSGFNLIILGEMWHFLAWMHLQETYLYVSRLMGLEIYCFVRILCGALCAKFLNSYFESFTPFCFCHFYILCSGFSIQYSPASAWSKKMPGSRYSHLSLFLSSYCYCFKLHVNPKVVVISFSGCFLPVVITIWPLIISSITMIANCNCKISSLTLNQPQIPLDFHFLFV